MKKAKGKRQEEGETCFLDKSLVLNFRLFFFLLFPDGEGARDALQVFVYV
jgi:hypothetical protein